ncbi:Hsp20/alpha crystallin family protein [Limnochorda pilosa]|uniref:Molecular chaperone n=1 Tax=Limnochorda pilosa TaxID=1555112 RepID=A0A0K2SML6_LIMPI|nr:Hsp20/alpha crystallin family protein [Limnochorda pilosa]BAS28350.1 molecular chaperone [Limnochorda pilosa]
MSLSAWDPRRRWGRRWGRPWNEIERWRDELEHVMENLMAPLEERSDLFFRGWRPDADVVERDDAYVIRLDLPGIRREDLNVEVQEDRVIISGERRGEVREERDQFVRSERYAGRFRRILPLPGDADAENVRALLRNGVLEVTVPKVPGKQGRQVTIEGE